MAIGFASLSLSPTQNGFSVFEGIDLCQNSQMDREFLFCGLIVRAFHEFFDGHGGFGGRTGPHVDVARFPQDAKIPAEPPGVRYL